MIWDLHCRLSGASGKTPAERIAQIIEIAGRVGIERLVFYMGYPWSNDRLRTTLAGRTTR